MIQISDSPKTRAAIIAVATLKHAAQKSVVAANACEIAGLCRGANTTAEKRIAEAALAHQNANNAVAKFRRQ